MLLIKPLLAFRPSKIDLIFAGKTFFAGMLALYIAFRLDLMYPMWAIGTVFILANPYAGMVSSKCIYRLIGTLIGAAFAIAITPYLINSPWLFTLVLAIWTGFCLYISMLDRTPRSYMFMLAGYTAVMIVCNAINNINQINIFDIALGRVLEISLAIVVSAVVSATIFPLHLGAAIQQRVNQALQDSAQVFHQLFEAEQHADTLALLAVINRDINDIHGLAVHLSYEKGQLKGMTKPLQEMLHQFSLVLLNLTAISERLSQLAHDDASLRSALHPIKHMVLAYLQQAPSPAALHGRCLPDNFEACFAKFRQQQPLSPSASISLASLQMDVRHLIQNVYRVKLIWQLIQQGDKRLPEFISPLTTDYPSLHRDSGVAFRGAMAAVLSIVVAFGLWIYSGWQYGYMMAQMAAVISCILTALDNPIPTLKVFMRGTFYAMIIVLIYLFCILPDVKAFWQLALVLAPVMIYALCLIPHPPLTGLGLPIAINVVMALNLQNHYQINPLASIDAALAGLVGPIIAILALLYIRAMSPEMSAVRLLAAHYQAMRKAMQLPFGNLFNIHIRSMIDRIAILNSKMVESQELKALMHAALIETNSTLDLARLWEIAQHPQTPESLKQQIQHLHQLFDREFYLQQQQPQKQHHLTEALKQSFETLHSQLPQMSNHDQQQRLAISLNNLRFSLGAAGTATVAVAQE
jgi:uncharacterized membrane protein YccC